MNVVCLTGDLSEGPRVDLRLWRGWSSLLLQVPRRRPGGPEDAGVFDIVLVIPPGLASTATRERDVGRVVAVVGMLAVDTDYSTRPPQSHHVVIADSIEPLSVVGQRSPEAQ